MKTIRKLIYGEVWVSILLVGIGFLGLFSLFDLMNFTEKLSSLLQEEEKRYRILKKPQRLARYSVENIAQQ